MDTYGPARAGRYVSFLKLFPKLFKITGSGPGLRVLKADPPAIAIAPREARPAQQGGASSSTDRAPRAIEVGPRAAYRSFPNETRKTFKDKNPARPTGDRFKRYEAYKRATSIGEARQLGATSQDISLDISSGALKLL